MALRTILETYNEEKKRISDDKTMDSKNRSDWNKQNEDNKKNAITNLVETGAREGVLSSYDQHLTLFEDSFESSIIMGNNFDSVNEVLTNLTKFYIMDQLDGQSLWTSIYRCLENWKKWWCRY